MDFAIRQHNEELTVGMQAALPWCSRMQLRHIRGKSVSSSQGLCIWSGRSFQFTPILYLCETVFSVYPGPDRLDELYLHPVCMFTLRFLRYYTWTFTSHSMQPMLDGCVLCAVCMAVAIGLGHRPRSRLCILHANYVSCSRCNNSLAADSRNNWRCLPRMCMSEWRLLQVEGTSLARWRIHLWGN